MSETVIDGVEVETVALGEGPGGNAVTRWRARQGVLLQIHSGPCTGWGEASPLPGYSPDTLEQARGQLEGLDLVGRVLDLDHPLTAAAEIAAGLSAPAARFAVETALLDLAGLRLRVPAWTLIGPARAGTRTVAEVLTGLVLSDGGPKAAGDLVRAQARGLGAAGAAAVKLKVGRDGGWSEELRVIRELREHLPHLALRLDANRAFGDRTEARLRDLLDLGLELIEEPGPAEQWLHLPPGAPPIALDETLRDPDGAEILERGGGRIGAVVLKPAAIGGLSAALGWAARAARLGVPAIVSHLFDGPIAASALRALALALPPGGPPHGLGLARARGARILASSGPGLDYDRRDDASPGRAPSEGR